MNSLTAWGLREAHKKIEKSGNRLLKIADLMDWAPIRQMRDNRWKIVKWSSSSE